MVRHLVAMGVGKAVEKEKVEKEKSEGGAGRFGDSRLQGQFRKSEVKGCSEGGFASGRGGGTRRGFTLLTGTAA